MTILFLLMYKTTLYAFIIPILRDCSQSLCIFNLHIRARVGVLCSGPKSLPVLSFDSLVIPILRVSLQSPSESPVIELPIRFHV